MQITPEDFSKPSKQAIEDNINAKYANKVRYDQHSPLNLSVVLILHQVIQKIGLCICLYDLLTSSEGLIGHGTGLVNVNVEFRLVVFRPFRHEVLHGRITSASPEGINLRTTFFSDIFVPATSLPAGTFFDHSQGVFIYRHPHIPDLMHFDTYEMARFRIEEEEWIDQTPEKPESDTAMDEEERRARRLSPWRIVASMADDGLGPCFWWDEDEEPEE